MAATELSFNHKTIINGIDKVKHEEHGIQPLHKYLLRCMPFQPLLMQKRISPIEIEKEYKIFLQTDLDRGKELNADLLIDISSQLFQETAITGVTTADDEDKDMLLFEYGIYNWGDEIGEHFSFEIARQFILDKDDEFYQLHFKLIFDPQDFKECDSYTLWSSDFQTLEDWLKDIKTSQGYKLIQRVSKG